MHLHGETLVLLTATVAFSLGVLSLLFSVLQAGTRGMRHWGVGLMGLGVGYLVMLFYPRFVGIGVLFSGWTLILLSLVVMFRGMQRICGGEQFHYTWVVLLIAVTGFGWGYFTLIDLSRLARINIMSIAVSVITARSAWMVWRFERRARVNAPAAVIAVILATVTASPLVEILMRSGTSDDADSPMEWGPVPVVFARLVIVVVLTMSVIWLEIYRLNRILEDLALRDEVTGIGNRRSIITDFERELARAEREASSCGIALFDVDYFKRINDTYGHPAGDQVLRWLVNILQGSVRGYDVIGRFGGEEFLLLMPNVCAREAVAVAERARIAVEQALCTVDGATIHVTVSAGVACSDAAAGSAELLSAADRALYRAKEGGRNRVMLAGA